MKLVGLTGGIASGKSAAASILRDLGMPVIDADQVARDVVAPGEPGLAAIVEAFGPGVLDAEGNLDRPAMRERITRDAEARATLNGITHPRIRQRILETLATLHAAGHPAAFVEAALLVETGGHQLYPDLWLVSCAPATQLARLMDRDGMTETAARALIATQLPLVEKERHATRVFRNDGSVEELRASVQTALSELIST